MRDGGFAFPEYGMEVEGKRVPLAHLVAYDAKPPSLDDENAIAANQQAWDWPQKPLEVLADARASILVADMLGAGVERHARLRVMDATIRVLLEHHPVIAVLWHSAQRFVEPKTYLAKQDDRAAFHLGAVNVRLFNVGNSGQMVMDSLGLSAFGLPDVQVHFSGLEPGRVASLLFSYAEYLFDHGDVIQDGHTVEGLEPGSKWRCQHEVSLVGPSREVLDINPGRPR